MWLSYSPGGDRGKLDARRRTRRLRLPSPRTSAAEQRPRRVRETSADPAILGLHAAGREAAVKERVHSRVRTHVVSWRCSQC